MQMTSRQQKGQVLSDKALCNLLENSLPQEEIEYAFAYGSGVFSQQSSKQPTQDENKMIDFVVVVRDAYQFHKENLALNPDHYAGPFLLARDRAARITWWQRHVMDNRFFRNPGVYFNLTDNSKYGVVQVDDLATDLTDWKYLYLAGRMHKPIVTILNRQEHLHSPSIRQLQEKHNLPAALSAALLLLWLKNDADNSETLTDSSLYMQIAALSYTGDPRMTAGAEDPEKIFKLVQSPGQLQRFTQYYLNALADLQTKGILSVAKATSDTSANIEWDDTSFTAHATLWKSLPVSLQSLYNRNDPHTSARALQIALPAIVAPAARYQSIKGLATAGLIHSWKYAIRKLSKGILQR